MKKKAFLPTLPDFIEIQRASFCWFLEKGLSEELEKFPSITDLDKNIELNFFGQEYKIRKPKYSLRESKRRNISYAIKIYVPISIIFFDISVKNKTNVFIGEFPLMTDTGIFLINGCERVIVNQIIRSPGVYYKEFVKKNSIRYRTLATIIPNKGSWLNFGITKEKKITVSVDKLDNIEILDFLNILDIPLSTILIHLKYPKILLQHLKDYSYNKSISDKEKLQKIFDNLIFNSRFYSIGKIGRSKINDRFNLNINKSNYNITNQDVIAILSKLIDIEHSEGNLVYHTGSLDDIDHLQNRRIKSVGELLQTQFCSGLFRLERILLEKLPQDLNNLKRINFISPKPIISMMREFFGSSQLSQFLNQLNPLADLTHKRRISSLGPGGLNRDHISFSVRDIHSSQYGRICPIETPEGQSAGLISSLSVYTRVNSFGFLETPFFQVKHGIVLLNKPAIYLTAGEEEQRKIAPADTELEKNGKIKNEFVTVRYNQEFRIILRNEVELISVSPIQIISLATALIPFLEHNDATRVLMGSNMQRQAVPLLYPSKVIVGTGFENQLASDAGMVVICYHDGQVSSVSNNYIKVQNKNGKKTFYTLLKYLRSNQDSCINQRPIVWKGEHLVFGQIIADGPGTDNGEIALGQNILLAYIPWEGYNYEDALLINERLVYSDLFTSIHIEKYEIKITTTLDEYQQLTKDIPNVTTQETNNLDNNGIISLGTFVHSGDILVGRVTVKDPSEKPYQKLLKAIFEIHTFFGIDSSLRVPEKSYGRVIDIRVFSDEKNHNLEISPDLNIFIFLAQIKKIIVGDKMAGRHGNKGIVSCILKREDMPYLPDGKPIDLILNPLGVPSRMNIGQLFEGLLGFSGDILDKRYKIMPFDEMYGLEASRILINNCLQRAKKVSKNSWIYNCYSPGKIYLKDGRTGQEFDNPITICKSYILKLVHLVDDKIHARSVGPYSLITQQPLKGRSKHGGQRFGEMEVWALEAFGAAYTLQEILTYKSDDILARSSIFSDIIKGKNFRDPGLPESFKVLILELKSLGLDTSIHKIEKTMNNELQALEIDIMEKNNLLPTYKSTEII